MTCIALFSALFSAMHCILAFLTISLGEFSLPLCLDNDHRLWVFCFGVFGERALNFDFRVVCLGDRTFNTDRRGNDCFSAGVATLPFIFRYEWLCSGRIIDVAGVELIVSQFPLPLSSWYSFILSNSNTNLVEWYKKLLGKFYQIL